MTRYIRLILPLAGLWIFSCASPEPHHAATGLRARDDLGHTVFVSAPPTRIVSLAPSITETLFALGLDSAVVGVTDYCDYPPQVSHLPRVGGMLNPAMEQIVSLRPDLVFMSGSGNLRSDYAQLSDLGLTVFVSYPRDLDGVLKSILDIGTLTGRDTRADSLVGSLRSQANRIRSLARENPHRTVLVLVSLRPLISVGPKTFLDEMIRLCNATNVAARAPTAYPMMSREEILAADPDRIVVTSDAVTGPSDLYGAFSEWHRLRAVADSSVILVNADTMTRPGPRIIQGLQELYAAIHGPIPPP